MIRIAGALAMPRARSLGSLNSEPGLGCSFVDPFSPRTAWAAGTGIGKGFECRQSRDIIELLDDLAVLGIFASGLSLAELVLEVLELGFQRVASQGADVVNKQLAVEVVGFMLDGAAEQVFGLTLEELSQQIEGLHLDLAGAADLGVEPGKAQAAFLILNRGMALDDLGVDEDQFLVLLLRVRRDIQDKEAEGQGHLVGGQTYPLRGIHEAEHLLNGRPEILIDLGHGP